MGPQSQDAKVRLERHESDFQAEEALMDFEEFMRAMYGAVDSIRAGDIDMLKVTRQWEDPVEERVEVFEMELGRDVASRLQAERMAAAVEALSSKVD